MEFEQLVAGALAAGGGMAAVWYVVRVLVKAGRDPTSLGAWFPRLVAGWHIGMTEKEEARLAHQEAKQKLVGAETPRELSTAVTTVKDAGEQPKDKFAASQNEEPVTATEVPGVSARTLPPHSGASRQSQARHRQRTSSPR
jgi:hypothetical protein